MSFDERHPDYGRAYADWVVIEDTYQSERQVKLRAFTYLPPTSGQLADGLLTDPQSPGRKAYEAYLTRAVFPEYVKEAVNTLVGVMHREPADIQLPAALEPMRKLATKTGESMEQLLRRINEQQLLYGRFGLLADVTEGGTAPHLVGYPAKAILNWDTSGGEFGTEKLALVVLDESGPVRSGFTWTDEKRYRALAVGDVGIPLGSEVAPDSYWTMLEVAGSPQDVIVPRFGGRSLDRIPFVVIGANDLALCPDDIPLLGLANLSLAIYRGEADYRQTLFMQAQDTLVVIGEEVDPEGQKKEEPTRVGCGAVLRLPAGGDAKYVGVQAAGLAEQRQALAADRTRAESRGSQLLQPPGSQAESGEALKVRVSASTASLFQIAKTGAAGLEQILRVCAMWVGVDPDQVRVTPNLEFAETVETPRSAQELMTAKTLGLPLSMRSIHQWLANNRFTTRSFEQEQELLKTEAPLPAAPGPAPGKIDFVTPPPPGK